MRFAIIGSGAVGGYYGAKLAQTGHDVTFIARGAHLAAMRERGLAIRSPLGDFVVRPRAEDDPARVPPVDVAIFAVKAYSNPGALPLLAAIARGDTVALTLQNGVDSVDDVAAAVGAARVLGGSTYIATALSEPGVIEQTGTHRRIVFGEVSGDTSQVSSRAQAIHDAFASADIISEPVADARVPIWEKFCYLSPFAACTGAARVPIGPLWADPSAKDLLIAAFHEVAAVARAEGVAISADLIDRIIAYVDSVPPSTRSSLLIDLQQGKPIEVEALLGTVVRRGGRARVPTPIMAALYAVLKPHAQGLRGQSQK
ncbi:MAG TPA: 2-dehydropantoate 2-reductase [Vicinamibacterales bacterium]|jgi:2-dehydropantoate 2-reductase|nr:2-dehydropantoate 2-reductase [Vicinamibacterales bacterium]